MHCKFVRLLKHKAALAALKPTQRRLAHVPVVRLGANDADLHWDATDLDAYMMRRIRNGCLIELRR